MATEYVTHQDLDVLRVEFRGEFAQLRGEFAELRGTIRGEMGELRGEMGELRGEMKNLQGELRGELSTQMRTIVYANVGLAVSVGGLVLAATQLA